MNIQKMMKQAQEMQAKMAKLQADAETTESEGSSGGGMVKVRMNGKGMLLKCAIDAKAMEDREMLEDLFVAAVNDAKHKSDTAMAEEMGKLTGSLQLPPGFKMPF